MTEIRKKSLGYSCNTTDFMNISLASLDGHIHKLIFTTSKVKKHSFLHMTSIIIQNSLQKVKSFHYRNGFAKNLP